MFAGIDIHQAIPIIRAFSHFALLANVAEDIHRERRRAIHVAAGDPPQDSTLAATYLKLDAADLDAGDRRRRADRRARLTGHHRASDRNPSSDRVRRPAPHHPADAVTRTRVTRTPTTAATSTPSCAARCSRCGRPRWFGCRACRSPTRSRSACGITRQRFSTSCRKSTPKSATPCAAAGPRPICYPEPILRPGSWIGGDRDGNPNVTADVVRLATGSAAYTALSRYTAELSALEQELSMSSRLVAVTDELSALAEDCDEPARGDEPYRRALRVIHARLTATATADPRRRAGRPPRPGLAAVFDAGGDARRSRHRRRFTARPWQHATGR